MKVSTTDYAKTLYEMTKGKSQGEIDGIVSDFAKFLLKKRQAGKIGKISEKFSQIWNAKNKTVDCEISSVQKLDDQVVEKIRKYVAEKYHAEKVNVENRIEGKLQGGIVIRVGNEMIDASVSGMIFRLKKSLTN